MLTNFAQVTNPGASNAADFQPETRNPQTAPGQLQQSPQQLQTDAQADILDNNQSTISVPSNPAPAAQAPPASSGINWLLVLVAVAAFAIGAALLWSRRRQPAAEPEPIEIEIPPQATEVKPAKAKPAPKPPTKKPAPKKSKSKRKKRARR